MGLLGFHFLLAYTCQVFSHIYEKFMSVAEDICHKTLMYFYGLCHDTKFSTFNITSLQVPENLLRLKEKERVLQETRRQLEPSKSMNPS